MTLLGLFWPRSLRGQVLLAIALALFLAQGIGALLLYRAQHERIEGALVHSAAFRLVVATRGDRAGIGLPPLPPAMQGPMTGDHPEGRRSGDEHSHREGGREGAREGLGRVEITTSRPVAAQERREGGEEADLRQILAEQDIAVDEVIIVRRPIERDSRAAGRLGRWLHRNPGSPMPDEVMIAAVRMPQSPQWLVARVIVPPAERLLLQSLFGQTLFIYMILVGAMWLLLRRITRPLAALTARLQHFAATRDPNGRLEAEGPDDIAHLIAAHNAMEARIVAMLDEKDVMLGAIGHDLKTPLAALRVRIESVEDDTERARMAATIEDITRSLDDILSLARVGRPGDPLETTELSALVAAVVEEYEDMGEPVELGDTRRVALRLRPTWVRRALRNLIGNALRYGRSAVVTQDREEGAAVIRIRDYGPGIAEDQIGRMLEPFTRGDPSRNSETGGAGIGLTLARAIAEQHGGTLRLENLRRPDGSVEGLVATLRLPLK